MDLKLENFDLLPISNVKHIKSPKMETLYDITVEGDHTFYIQLPNSEDRVLMHNCDGSHITSMLIGWFKKFAPNLFNEGRICKLQTPLIIIKDTKDQIKEYFFDLDSFKEWEAKNKNTKLKIQYQKGLGSVERSDMQWLMNINGGVNGFLYELNADDKAFSEIDLWLTGDAEPRKEKLRKYTLDINMI